MSMQPCGGLVLLDDHAPYLPRLDEVVRNDALRLGRGIDAHVASLFGLSGQLALTSLGLSLIAMVVLGYRM